jgi:hypothetical protein
MLMLRQKSVTDGGSDTVWSRGRRRYVPSFLLCSSLWDSRMGSHALQVDQRRWEEMDDFLSLEFRLLGRCALGLACN